MSTLSGSLKTSQQQPMTDQLLAPANGSSCCRNGAPTVPAALCSPVSDRMTGTLADRACTAGQLTGMLHVLERLPHAPSVKVAPLPPPLVEPADTGAVGRAVCRYLPSVAIVTAAMAPLTPTAETRNTAGA